MKKYGKRWVKTIERTDDLRSWVPYVSEVPAGSRIKYALDKDSGQIKLKRVLPSALAYPTNYGFIPRTLSVEDDMELDLMAISSEPLVPLTVCRVRVVGGCSIRADADVAEDKLIGVVVDDPDVDAIADLEDVDPELRGRIETFFTTYKQNQGIHVSFGGWYDRGTALERVRQALEKALEPEKT